MSRCFPFPPPGYAKKAGPDYENLLEKEKEKKHKKEKKEKKEKKDKKDKKEKKGKKERDGKRNKDKEKIDDKHREYDDQNEKCKENSYTAEKEQKRNSDGKSIAGVLGCSNGENPGSNFMQANGTSDFKFLVELGKRIRDEDKATASPIIRKMNLTCKRTSDLPEKVLKDNRDGEGKIFGQSNKVDAQGYGNGSGPNFMVGSESKVGVVGLMDNYAEKKMEQKENDKSSDSKAGRRKDNDRDKKSKSKDRKSEKKKAKEDKAKEKAAINVQPNAKENNVNAVFDNNGNLSSFLKENSKNSQLGKRKELEMNGNVLRDDIRRSKLQILLASSHEVEENGRKLEARISTHTCVTSTQSVSELVGTVNNQKVHRTASSSRLVIQNGPKLGLSSDKIPFGEHSKVNISVQPSRQVMENGNILEMGTAAASEWWGTNNDHRMDSKVSLFHPVLTNGKVELQQDATDLAIGVHAPISSQNVNWKEIKFNGLIEDKKPDVSLTKPSVSLVKVKKSVGKSLKPPHPDSKYVNQLLNISSIKWSGFDDQEWLLGSTDPQVRSGVCQAKETKQVWAEALRIESADITALPYVLPF